MAEPAPEQVGTYRVQRELGRGGMGIVYEVEHAVLGRRALKVLLGEVSRDDALVQRFFNEARAAAAIKHESIVEVYDVGSVDGRAYIVMELLAGESLAARLKARGMLPIAAAVELARQCAVALAAAHAADIVHRDLKPDNVFLVAGDRVKLLDFGVAKLVGDRTAAVAHTVTGAILGTPHYMSPEQCEGAREVDHRSDLYSLGCMLFQMLAGRLPFQSDGVGGLIGMHLHVAPPALRTLRPDAPVELEALVARLLAKSPDDRFQTATEVAGALTELPRPADDGALSPTLVAPRAVIPDQKTVATIAPPTVRTRPRRWIVPVCVAVVAAGCIVAYAVTRGDEPASEPIVPPPAPVVVIAMDAGADAAVDAAVEDPDLAEAHAKLRQADYIGALVAVRAAKKRRPDDRSVLAVEREVQTARARHELDRMRIAEAKNRPDDVKEAYDRFYDATQNILEEMRPDADEVWRRVVKRGIADATREIRALVDERDCERATETARRASARWGKPLVALVKNCKPRIGLPDGKWMAESIQQRGAGDATILSTCHQLITIARQLLPYEICIAAACSFAPAEVGVFVMAAPLARQEALRRMCAPKQ